MVAEHVLLPRAGSIAEADAGLAGLAAVCELADRGHEVSRFGRGRLVGGKATSFVVDGVEVVENREFGEGCSSSIAAAWEARRTGSPKRGSSFRSGRPITSSRRSHWMFPARGVQIHTDSVCPPVLSD